MNIDRHNYEMYFLLYVDNELSSVERTAVENFVAENTDLKTELDLLIQTTLPAEAFIFSSKQDLYKNELTAHSFNEQMLLHLDSELEPKFVESLTSAMAKDVNLKREWNILQQTKLDVNESVIFEDKKSLYRYEKNNLVSMRFWRSVAAVLIIGLTVFVGVTKYSNKDSNAEVASNSDNGIKQVKKKDLPGIKDVSTEGVVKDEQPNEAITSNQVDPKAPDTNEEILSNQTSDNSSSMVRSNKISTVEKTGNPNITVKNSRNDKRSLVQKETNHLPKPYFENINNPNSNKTSLPFVKDNTEALKNKKDELAVLENGVVESKLKASTASMEDVSLTETRNVSAKNTMLDEASAENGNNSVLFLNEEKINRTKISGLFRKVKRVLTRNANIETGNSVKIAGFEIATK